ncbi:MAG TPA: BamA/TamA family outer membrane protein [Gemmatimonadales bacterium]|nr:BamA/TamA family outer membrane protein [Gemmatimonadales bacterium]
MKRTLELLALVWIATYSPANAQEPDTQTGPTPAPAPEPEPRAARWRTSYFPYFTGGANDSPVLAFRLRHWQPAEYEARTTYTAALNADAGIASRGSRFVSLQYKAPGLWEDWRLVVQGKLERQARYGYFGLGNETVDDQDAVGDDDPFLYRMRRTRYRASAEVTRRIKGHLHVALLAEYEHAKFTSLPGPSIFASDFPPGELKQDDAAGRLALIYDSRDNEFNTQRGLLLEAGTQVGSGGDGYTRQYAIFRGYLPVREGTVVAARVAGSGMGGTPPLDARFTLPGWEQPIPVLGGEYSNRGLDYGRLTGRGTLFGNLEVRHDLLPFGDLGAISLIAFIDAGRVFEGEDFRLTTEDMKVGGGGGIALRILRSSIFTFNFAGGPDGFNFSVGSGWMF